MYLPFPEGFTLPLNSKFTEKLNHFDETFLVTTLLRSIGVVAGGAVKKVQKGCNITTWLKQT